MLIAPYLRTVNVINHLTICLIANQFCLTFVEDIDMFVYVWQIDIHIEKSAKS